MLIPLPPFLAPPTAQTIQRLVFGLTIVACIVIIVLQLIFGIFDPPKDSSGKIRGGALTVNIVTVVILGLATWHLI